MTGRVTVAQWPNGPLWVFVVAALGSRVFDGRDAGRVLSVIATVALVVWASLEIVDGVNPFRRLVGAGVLGAVVVTAVVTAR